MALGITDYFSVRTYKAVRDHREAGRLKDIALIFPNIELRLTIETREGQGINLHLLVSPEDTEHIARIEEKLAQLRFRYGPDQYPCSEDGLKRLGRAHRNDSTLSDENALAEGANQFKIELSRIRELWDGDPWFRSNVLIAVSGGKDGLAGISRDAGFHAQREELGRFAHIVFSGSPQDRNYWLGQHPDFISNKQTPKPCLHGSDAHALEGVLAPAQSRLCWLRADPTFDGLRQALVEPERRVHIGETAPSGPNPSDVIRSLRLRNAPWLLNESIDLNDGLVTVIGAKGSGKTALADMIAFAADAGDAVPGPASFIAKAGGLLNGVVVDITWGDGSQLSADISGAGRGAKEPRVRYLSQQFVERLCSTERLAKPLVDEIERVVFSAIPEENRYQCATFSELRALVLEGASAERDAQRESIRADTIAIAEEAGLQRSIPQLRAKADEVLRQREALEKQLSVMPVKVDVAKVQAHQAILERLKKLKGAIAAQERRSQQLKDVYAEIVRQSSGAATAFAALKAKQGQLLTESQWDLLRLRLDDDALPSLTRLRDATRARITTLRERGLEGADQDKVTDGSKNGLVALESENARLTAELGLDQTNVARRLELQSRLTSTRQSEENARKELAHAEKAPERLKQIQSDRLARYERVFDALRDEEEALRGIYEPLRQRLASDPRLSKLTLTVSRVVDVDAWAERGEALLDLRKPPFAGRGALADIARKSLLKKSWETGGAIDARLAMGQFVSEYAGPSLEALAHGSTPLDLGEWIFSTDHIAVRYGIQYEGVELTHLSPGTRGVVLLTLYLALDQWDHRPLLIDQPEENLDPKSVYADLVPFFREAARRRQIVMVTHNANLVVNTDSDQVIVAEAERKSPASLPTIRYHAGALEDAEIRAEVCGLLEGGEDAFKKRGRRYNVA